jgi:hypothetical protein
MALTPAPVSAAHFHIGVQVRSSQILLFSTLFSLNVLVW